MTQFGDSQAGFSVAFHPDEAAVRVRAWGFWSALVAAQFGNAVREACHDCPRGTALVLDMTELKPMRDEGQVSVGVLMKVLPKLGLAKTTVMTSSHLTKLQLLRLATECGVKDLVQFT